MSWTLKVVNLLNNKKSGYQAIMLGTTCKFLIKNFKVTPRTDSKLKRVPSLLRGLPVSSYILILLKHHLSFPSSSFQPSNHLSNHSNDMRHAARIRMQHKREDEPFLIVFVVQIVEACLPHCEDTACGHVAVRVGCCGEELHWCHCEVMC